MMRNKYYKENPLLKNDTFTSDDESEIEKWLRRTKQPLLMKYKKSFLPAEYVVNWKNEAAKKFRKQSITKFENFVTTEK